MGGQADTGALTGMEGTEHGSTEGTEMGALKALKWEH